MEGSADIWNDALPVFADHVGSHPHVPVPLLHTQSGNDGDDADDGADDEDDDEKDNKVEYTPGPCGPGWFASTCPSPIAAHTQW